MPGIRCGARELGIGHDGAGPQAMARLDLDLREAAAETHDHSRHAAVAHQQIRSEPDHHHRDLARQVRQEIGEICLVRRREQHLRRPADPEPRDIRQHRIGATRPRSCGIRLAISGRRSGKLMPHSPPFAVPQAEASA